jgi:hypothetical protein
MQLAWPCGQKGRVAYVVRIATKQTCSLILNISNKIKRSTYKLANIKIKV